MTLNTTECSYEDATLFNFVGGFVVFECEEEFRALPTSRITGIQFESKEEAELFMAAYWGAVQ